MSSTLQSNFPPRHPRRRWMTACLALSMVVGASTPARAAERVWDGSARSDGWNDIGNWVGVGVPAAGDSLRFPAGALKLSNNNDFPAGTSFNTLTYAGAGYSASGNEIGLTGGIVVSHGAGNTSLHLPINIALNQTFTVSLAGANLYLFGTVDLVGSRSILTFDGAGQTVVVGNISDSRVIVGGGTIRKNGAGTLYVLQHLTLGGPTIVNGGTLIMDGRMSNSAVTVNASATLRGIGKVGGLTVNSGGTVGPGLNSPDILDSLGDVALNAGSTFNVRLNGTSVGLNYDQLKVQGTVTLGGMLNVTAGFTAAVGDTFTIIENDGNDDVVGIFAGLPERAILMINGRPFQISYGGRGTIGGGLGRDVNDVTLEAVPALAVWDGEGNQNKFWSLPLNWVGDVLPMPGDDVQFTNPNSTTMTTSNDFPSGRVFGSIIFAGGDHRVGGNLADFQGDIRMTQPGDVQILIPMALKGGFHLTQPGDLMLSGPVTLKAGQTFWVDHSNACLRVEGQVEMGSHNLMIRNITGSQPFLIGEYPSVYMSGGLGGTGSLTKEGPGILSFEGTSSSPGSVIVNEGTLSAYAVMAGLTLVNTGAVINLGYLDGDLDVRGGMLVTGYRSRVRNARLLEGSVFRATVGFDNYVTNTSLIDFPIGNSATLELSGCTLDLQLAEDPVIASSTIFEIVNLGSLTGMFEGLPSGKRFAVGGVVFEIGYGSGTVGLVADLPMVWDGGGGGNLWTTASNWVADFAPLPPGNHLVFPANVSKLAMINDFAPGSGFPSLTFGGSDYLLVGNSFRLTQGIYNDFSFGETVINADFVADRVAFDAFGSTFECRVGDTSRLRLEGSITGNAYWSKTGTGTLRFSGTTPNSPYFFTVRAGELELDKSPGVDAISDRLVIGDGANDVRVILLNDQQITDSALVNIRTGARLDLNGRDEVIDRLEGDGTVSLNGRFIPGRSGRLTLSSGYFTGTIVGDGGLTKTGSSSSSLWLVGENTFTGLTILSAGQLRVDGIQTVSPIRLNGGVLRGRGQVGTITGNLGGTVQPGLSVAVFQNRLHSRDMAFNSSTTFRPVLTAESPGFENSQLLVSGTVSLGGCVLNVDLLGTFKPTNGASFVIIDNDGSDPVVGTFAGLPESAVFGGEGLPFRISYVGGTGNDVVIARVAAPASMLGSITALGNGQMRIDGQGIWGVVYPIQAASNFNPVIFWTNVGNGTGDASGVFRFIDTGASNRPMRFYRAVSP